MDIMPTLKWEKEEEDYRIASITYYLQIKGTDEDGRLFFYHGKVQKQTTCSSTGKLSTVYDADYSLYTDAHDLKARATKNSQTDIKTLAAAKKWVEKAFQRKWAKDHA